MFLFTMHSCTLPPLQTKIEKKKKKYCMLKPFQAHTPSLCQAFPSFPPACSVRSLPTTTISLPLLPTMPGN